MYNETGFAVVSLFNSLILTVSMTSLLISSPKKISRILIFAYLSLCQIFAGRSLGQNITFFTIGGVFLILIFMEKHAISNTILASLGYLLTVAINYCLTVPLNLSGFTLSYMSDFPYILPFMIVYGLLTISASLVLGRFIRSSVDKNRVTLPKKLQLLFLLEMLFCVAVCIFNIIQGGKENFPPKAIYFNAILFITFFVITFVTFFFCLHIMQKNHELIQMQQEKQTLEDYTEKLEILYQDMRIFRHEYINILSTMQYYIDDNDTEKLKDYFTSKILPGSEKLVGKNDTIGKLSSIKVLALKGLLYSKILSAMNQGLNITLEIQDDVTEVAIEMIDLSVIIGAFLDNAIDAAAETKDRKLVIAIIENNAAQTFIISNSSPDMTLSLDDIYEKERTSKSGHHGLGLYSVHKILDKYPNIIHSTSFSNHTFTQMLEIYDDA